MYWHGPQPQLVVTEAELIKEIMNNKDGVYPKIDLEGHAKKLLGDGLSSTKGDKWTKLRKIANGVFHGESLKVRVHLPLYIYSRTLCLKIKGRFTWFASGTSHMCVILGPRNAT